MASKLLDERHIKNIRINLYRTLVYSSWYACDKKHMMQKFKWHKCLTRKQLTMLRKLSPKKRKKLINDAWSKPIKHYQEQREYSRKCARSNRAKRLEKDIEDDGI